MMRSTSKLAPRRRSDKSQSEIRDKQPLIDHLRELRRRLLYVGVTVLTGGAAVYAFEHQIIGILLHPSHGQQFIYTSPLGGMNFLYTVCLDMGLILATPVIVYQLLAFLRPLMHNTTRRFLLVASGAAALAAMAGVAFGYFVGLPNALHFLLNQFTSIQVRPLITIQSYTQFVAMYLLGSALMFQLPLIVLLINRIKPLKPQKLLKYERHVAIGSLLMAFIMNPSPNLIEQLFVVVPIFASYQAGILLLWLMQYESAAARELRLMREEDARLQAERLNRPLEVFTPADLPLLPVPRPKPPTISIAVTVVEEPAKSVGLKTTKPSKPQKQRQFMDFMPKAQQPLMPLRRHIPVVIQ